MDHFDLEERHVADRYLQGKLSAGEVELFEQHYLDCPECLERLEIGEKLQRGFRRVAREEVETLGRRLWLAGWRRRLLSARIYLAPTIAVVAGLSTLWFWQEVERVRRAHSNLVVEVEKSAEAQQALIAEVERGRHERATLETELAASRAESAQPQKNLEMIFLDVVRGSGAQVIELRADRRIVLAYEPPSPLEASYRAELWRGRERRFALDGLVPNALRVLTLSFESGQLEAGSYELRIFPQQSQNQVARLRFEARK